MCTSQREMWIYSAGFKHHKRIYIGPSPAWTVYEVQYSDKQRPHYTRCKTNVLTIMLVLKINNCSDKSPPSFHIV